MDDSITEYDEKLKKNISTLKNNKNPFWVFFVLAEIKDIFISLGEKVLNSIELRYSPQAKKQYKLLTSKYKEVGVFEALYHHYLHSDELQQFENEIDDYFENSFFLDLSFFLFTLSTQERFSALFECMYSFYLDNETKKTYFSFWTYEEKVTFLKKVSQKFSFIASKKETYFIIEFLNYFESFDFGKIKVKCKSLCPEEIKFFKKMILYVLKNKETYSNLYGFLINTFVVNENIYIQVIETLEEPQLFEVISFLKNDIYSWMDEISLLDYQTKAHISSLLDLSFDVPYFDLEKKIDFLLEKEKLIGKLWVKRWNYARLSFKRQYLEKKYEGIIDLILWITNIPPEVFYLAKEETHGLDIQNIELYKEMIHLILYIESSYFLSFARPFLLRKISKHFNTRVDYKYYVIKFIAFVVLPQNYREYQIVSKFFNNLEVFSKHTFFSYIQRFFQFGWVIVFFAVWFYFLPFGFFLAILLLGVVKFGTFIISKISPKLTSNLNFHLSSLFVFFGILFVILWWTLWFQDHLHLTYEKLKPAVNAAILPAHESMQILYDAFGRIKVNIFEAENEINSLSLPFGEIDYLQGEYYYQIKK